MTMIIFGFQMTRKEFDHRFCYVEWNPDVIFSEAELVLSLPVVYDKNCIGDGYVIKAFIEIDIIQSQILLKWVYFSLLHQFKLLFIGHE